MPGGRPIKDQRLAACREEDCYCEDCIGACARDLTALSPGLSRPALRALFHALYSEPACRRMEARFVQICLPPKPAPVLEPALPPVFLEPLHFQVAAA